MTTAVHGKASLAQMLLDDGAAPAKSGDDDRDKIDTVDFGATLMSLVDPAVAKNSPPDTAGASPPPSVSHVSSKRSLDATSPFASDTDDALASLDADAVPSEHYSATPSEHYWSAQTETSVATSDAQATPLAGSANGRTFSERIAALFASNSTDSYDSHVDAGNAVVTDRYATVDGGDAPADDSGGARIEIHTAARSYTEATNAKSAPLALAAIDTPEVIAETDIAQAPGADSSVPNRDIALDFRKQVFPVAAKDESATAQGTQFSKQPTIADIEQIASTLSTRDIATSHPTDSAHAGAPRSQNGMSPALSSQSASANQDSMQTSDPTLTHPTLANASADAATLSEQQMTHQPIDGIAQAAPEQQRTRTDGLKDDSPQAKTAPTLETDSITNASSQPAAHAPETAAIRQVTDAAPVQSSRSVNITVQLAEGQSAQASVREHAGAVEVKIVTPNASSAQRVSSEIEGLRQNLNDAGIRLGHSEVSYQQGDGGRQGREQYRPQSQNQSADGKEVFVVNEVNQ